eukprot:CAMPEP_0185756092 /NCGR_PEP_ID=MMETSP1174-20130828/14537_1 /TAXON_ID=35687 /ORGANISM="Dictyocha speculum, Strain CCMP1381" /LENGTH=918 /DNA_ID=CAMNT_0028434901 /DNA_START=107 /DNA_END=2863 /DNA_ORIENTATION=+
MFELPLDVGSGESTDGQNQGLDDFGSSEFLSPFVDEVDFGFPEENGEMLDDIPRVKKRRRNEDDCYDDELSSAFDGSLDMPGTRSISHDLKLSRDKLNLSSMSWDCSQIEDDQGSISPHSQYRPIPLRIKLDNSNDAPKHRNRNGSHHTNEQLEDLLGVLASRVEPVDGSTAEFFDSDDDGGSDEGSCAGSEDEDDCEFTDIKPMNLQALQMTRQQLAAVSSMMMPGMVHPGLAFPKSEFDMQMLHGAPNGFKMEDLGSGRKPKRGRKRRKITPEEKAELTRQRNREHARSTRRRKKMYVECLKKQVAELLAKQHQIDAGILEPLSSTQAEEISSTRKSVVQTFFQYRATNMVDESTWNEILEDNFTLTQPRTPFRATNIGEMVGNCRKCEGAESIAHDTASIAAMFDMIKARVRQQKPDFRRKMGISYDLEPGDILCVGDRLMCSWNSSTSGLKAAGFENECGVDGMLRCSFSSKHKLVDMEITYDVMAFTRQLQQHSLIDLSVITPKSAVSRSGSMPNLARSSSNPTCKIPLRGNNMMSNTTLNSLKQMKKVKSSGNLPGIMPNLANMMGMTGGMMPMMGLGGLGGGLGGMGGIPNVQNMKIQIPGTCGLKQGKLSQSSGCLSSMMNSPIGKGGVPPQGIGHKAVSTPSGSMNNIGQFSQSIGNGMSQASNHNAALPNAKKRAVCPSTPDTGSQRPRIDSTMKKVVNQNRGYSHTGGQPPSSHNPNLPVVHRVSSGLVCSSPMPTLSTTGTSRRSSVSNTTCTTVKSPSLVGPSSSKINHLAKVLGQTVPQQPTGSVTPQQAASMAASMCAQAKNALMGTSRTTAPTSDTKAAIDAMKKGMNIMSAPIMPNMILPSPQTMLGTPWMLPGVMTAAPFLSPPMFPIAQPRHILNPSQFSSSQISQQQLIPNLQRTNTL